MSYKKYLASLKNSYHNLDKKKEMLEGVIAQCKSLGFDSEKTSILVGVISGTIPGPGEQFSDLPQTSEEDRLMIAELLRENYDYK